MSAATVRKKLQNILSHPSALIPSHPVPALTLQCQASEYHFLSHWYDSAEKKILGERDGTQRDRETDSWRGRL